MAITEGRSEPAVWLILVPYHVSPNIRRMSAETRSLGPTFNRLNSRISGVPPRLGFRADF